ncbi:helix-turn-helix transcriptional regulator [Paenibacillus sp. CFBP 13594]|uniref:helix-turn-helix domain-containing protein n=1 Tax=Paenibacillus sp. CFBP 13594 TaxID=2774037 RepID=UPI00177AB06D|nr:helix-turn-helix transcriptional regulator [Paenibacillus sp. CFBP 13594]MBD8836216.1 helix-turn-helix transcriptional regulator [Paenibacillus sp. CFBP 13594]
MKINNHKGWAEIKKSLNYTSEVRKKMISLSAKLTVAILGKQEEAGISNADLALKAQVSERSIVDLTEDDSVPSIEVLIKLALAMDMELEII